MVVTRKEFVKALEKSDIDFVLRYLEQSKDPKKDLNFEIERKCFDNWDGPLAVYSNVTCYPLDIVDDDNIKNFLCEYGALSYSEVEKCSGKNDNFDEKEEKARKERYIRAQIEVFRRKYPPMVRNL